MYTGDATKPLYKIKESLFDMLEASQQDDLRFWYAIVLIALSPLTWESFREASWHALTIVIGMLTA